MFEPDTDSQEAEEDALECANVVSAELAPPPHVVVHCLFWSLCVLYCSACKTSCGHVNKLICVAFIQFGLHDFIGSIIISFAVAIGPPLALANQSLPVDIECSINSESPWECQHIL